MGGLVKSIFGGTDRSAQKAQISANASNQGLFQNLADQSAQTSQSLYSAADTNRNLSLQQILDLLGGTIPQQLSAQQQGNMGAQRQLIGGLPMVQDAIMGRPVNMGALQPTQINYNTGFANQRLPQFTTSQQALAKPAQPQQQIQPDYSSLLGGIY